MVRMPGCIAWLDRPNYSAPLLTETDLVRRLRRNFHRRCQRLLELALAVRALRHRSRFQPLFDQVAGTAVGAFLLDRFSPRHEVAFRIAVTSIKCFSALGSPL